MVPWEMRTVKKREAFVAFVSGRKTSIATACHRNLASYGRPDTNSANAPQKGNAVVTEAVVRTGIVSEM